MKKFLSSLLLALTVIVTAAPAYADDACKNLLDDSKVSVGEVSSTTGVPNSNAGFGHSDYIEVIPGEQYTYSLTPTFAAGAGRNTAFYDANKTFVSGLTSMLVTNSTVRKSATFTVPSGVKYVRVSMLINGNNLTADTDIQLERGSTATAYQPYNPLCATCQGTVVSYESVAAADVPAGMQDGTPSPTNPIEPVFYKQGDMVLRRIGDYADSYDATTGKITRRIGVKVYNGTENLTMFNTDGYIKSDASNVAFVLSSGRTGINNESMLSSMLSYSNNTIWQSVGYPNTVIINNKNQLHTNIANEVLGITDYTQETQASVINKAEAFFKSMYDAGHPVTVYYPLETPYDEDWATTSYCRHPIKIATTAYNNNAFSSVQTALNNAVTAIKDVVSNTIAQAAAVQSLQAGKQTMPDASDTDGTCPRFRQCLLIQDPTGKPHWYPILDPFRDFVTPILANNNSGTSYSASAGYQQVEYIESDGTQWIDTGVAQKDSTGEATSYGMELQYSYPGNASSSVSLCGAWTRTNEYSAWGQIYGTGGKSEIWMGNPNAAHVSITGIQKNTIYTDSFVVDVSAGSVTRTRNGQTVNETGVTFTPANPNTAFLFGFNKGNGTGEQMATLRMYYAKVFRNNVLVRDMVPVLDKYTNKYGMYDKVNGVFYPNANTASGATDFAHGANVANDPDIPSKATWQTNLVSNSVNGIVYGTAVVNAVSGTRNDVASSSDLNSSAWTTGGRNCWCKVTGVRIGNEYYDVPNMEWVYEYSDRSNLKACSTNCGYGVKNTDLQFRRALFNG